MECRIIFTDSRRVGTYISSDVASPTPFFNSCPLILSCRASPILPWHLWMKVDIVGVKMGGCDYFLWYEDRYPPQANRVMWGLLKKVNAFDEKLKLARHIFIVGVIATGLVMFRI
ncbi:hypothetical protein H5410_041465 [Solanum commersonii]|uniref:Uncharacterized protein n=1 Tax=Solanum commersonii TaxID=4109 RepID=A0A9J5XTP6_SOLCO|nr:hypothetical protein H5410_041465 [Solanum commersonii]